MRTPAADVTIDEPLVRRLLAEQHPDLAELGLELVGNGWDNVLYRLGAELVVRLPRRRVAAELVEHEQRWLPRIASRVTVSVPEPVRIGAPTSEFPYSWTIARWLPGDLATERADSPFAEELAQFVRELHTEATPDAPRNPVRGVPLAVRKESVESRFDSGLVADAEGLREVWRRALAARPWAFRPRWLHGDLHPANLLTQGGHLAAVLDFGDVCGGDPATDLATAWLSLDAPGRERFANALDYDDATWLRAAGWAVVLGTAFVTSSGDNPAMHDIGAAALRQVLIDP